jgi:hypothetical protein
MGQSMYHRQIVAARYKDKLVKQNTTYESDWTECKPRASRQLTSFNSLGMGMLLETKKKARA